VREVARLLHIEDKLQTGRRSSRSQMQRLRSAAALFAPASISWKSAFSLDAKLRGEMRIELQRIQRALGATFST